MWAPEMNLAGGNSATLWDQVGLKSYELSNHLGNVLATISDKRTGVDGNYDAEVKTAQDYYPFGMLQPGRQYNSAQLINGFNGKRYDHEVYGVGNFQDYGMRMYASRLGRFLSVDPLTQKYPWYSPYQFAGNTPIQATDLDGAEEYHYTLSLDKNGRSHIQLNSVEVYKEHSFLGYKWTTPIYTERAVVKYEGKDYYIGFAGSYGRGNEDGMNLFNKFKLNPDASLFSKMFLSEDKSNSVEEYSSAVQMQNNAAMYGPLTSKAWYTANQQEGNVTPTASPSPVRGINNPATRAAVVLGNRVHYDQLNGGTGVGLPTELSLRYPSTQFRFTPRGAKGPDVQVVGGLHPSLYPGSTWLPGRNFGDFKPATPSGIQTFNRDVRTGKLPLNTQLLEYNSTTGALK